VKCREKIWLLDVTIAGRVRRVEEFGQTIEEARENAAARHGLPLTCVASIRWPDCTPVSREGDRP